MSARVIAKCAAGHVVKAADWNEVEGGWLRCPCGMWGLAQTFAPKLTERKCGSVCQGATGPACSCSCGGENHGSGRAFIQ